MDCPRCHSQIPEVAHFCHACGQDLRSADTDRRESFALRPDEPVASFAIVSTIMPRGSSRAPQTYRLAVEIALAAVAVAAVLGAVPVAVILAAMSVPLIYIVYLYDVNLWEDEPVTVTLAAFGLTFVLASIWVWFTQRLVGGPALVSGGFEEPLQAGPTLAGFLVAGLLAPIVGEIIRQVGPIFLASRPRFDDLMDGLTFGVISGVAFATADTLVKHWPLLQAGFGHTQDAGTWLSLLVLEGFVKPLVLGTATGIACAEFSGLGEGYDGFTARYARGFAEAAGAAVLFFGGTYLLTHLIQSQVLGLVAATAWGLLLLAGLILRVRNVLHKGLLEAALESQARSAGAGADEVLAFCSRCEMPLMPRAAFCTNCGTSVRVAGHAKAHAGPPPDVPETAGAVAGAESATTREGGEE